MLRCIADDAIANDMEIPEDVQTELLEQYDRELKTSSGSSSGSLAEEIQELDNKVKKDEKAKASPVKASTKKEPTPAKACAKKEPKTKQPTSIKETSPKKTDKCEESSSKSANNDG